MAQPYDNVNVNRRVGQPGHQALRHEVADVHGNMEQCWVGSSGSGLSSRYTSLASAQGMRSDDRQGSGSGQQPLSLEHLYGQFMDFGLQQDALLEEMVAQSVRRASLSASQLQHRKSIQHGFNADVQRYPGSRSDPIEQPESWMKHSQNSGSLAQTAIRVSPRDLKVSPRDNTAQTTSEQSRATSSGGAKAPHSVVEKNRRDKIAKAIDELRALVPMSSDAPKTHYGYGADQRPKHFVIRAAIAYIKELLRVTRYQKQVIEELRYLKEPDGELGMLPPNYQAGDMPKSARLPPGTLVDSFPSAAGPSTTQRSFDVAASHLEPRFILPQSSARTEESGSQLASQLYSSSFALASQDQQPVREEADEELPVVEVDTHHAGGRLVVRVKCVDSIDTLSNVALALRSLQLKPEQWRHDVVEDIAILSAAVKPVGVVQLPGGYSFKDFLAHRIHWALSKDPAGQVDVATLFEGS